MTAIIGIIVTIIIVMVILFTRYESPQNLLKSTEYLESHLNITRKWVQIYIDSNDISTVNYRNISDDDIMPVELVANIGTDDPVLDNDNDTSTFNPPNVSSVKTQVIPDPDRNGYWIFFVDISANTSLTTSAPFIEKLFLNQYCVKDNFGTALIDAASYNSTTKKFDESVSSTKFACTIPE